MSSALYTPAAAKGQEAELVSSAILHRTPWKPATAVRAEGVYYTLSDGSRLIDAVGT